MENISGYIEHIIFSNKENGYTVFELTTDTEEITCVGDLHAAGEGMSVSLTGDWTMHPVYGRQFAFTKYEMSMAEDEASILRYLSSGAVKGIGPARAKKIVNAFGTDTFRVMEEEPEMLSKVSSISVRLAQEIGAFVTESRDQRKIMVFLQKFGISNNLALKIYRTYGNSIYGIMEQNPYRLAEDIEGVGFRTADEIALAAGTQKESEYRLRSGILYVLSSSVAEGHIYLPDRILVKRAAELLEIPDEYVEGQLQALGMDRKIILKRKDEGIRAYLPSLYYAELACARMLADLDISFTHDITRIEEKVKNLEDEEIPLEDRQREAVVSAISHGVSVITGGPGTGKTTIIDILIRYLQNSGEEFILCAPTGRAAKRMSEATGYESFTIQRLLKVRPDTADRGFSYEYNEENPLEVDAIIVDEMSMVDLPLFKALLSAIVPGCRLIMVGDTNQLPSVGPGSILRDIIASDRFKVVRLDRIFRQSEAGDIVVGAHMINAGKMPKFDNDSRDLFLLERNDTDRILKHIVLLAKDKLPPYVHARPFDIQVLTPMRKGPLGVENLNPVLQKYLNPPSPHKKEKQYMSTLYREGDKVMQIRNDYQLEWEVTSKYGIIADRGLGIFNGDMGIVDRIDENLEIMEVLYDENRRVRYPFSDLDELELSYAVTIHKSQGSEYPAVIIPLLTGPRQLFNRNLLYTAITRARDCVCIVGSRDTVERMIDNADELKRYTSLDEAIIEIKEIEGIS